MPGRSGDGVTAKGKLYVVGTPVGNLGDMPPRAIETLSGVDFIAAEDTRVSMVLMQRFGIKTRLVSYHKFNETGRAGEIVREILAGRNCAVITDAGTPCISDPGSIVAAYAVREGIEVIGIPGPCAAVLALSVSGFEISSYGFYGFFPKGGALRTVLSSIRGDSQNTAVFYESPNRIIGTVEAVGEEYPNAEICLCNDLTKRFEMIYRGRASEVLAELRSNPYASKGEYTFVFNKNCDKDTADESPEMPSIESGLVDIMIKNGNTLKDAAAIFHERHGNSKKSIYAASLKLKKLFCIDN